jgi:hypothetical protein
MNFNRVAYDATRDEWGGVTFDMRTRGTVIRNSGYSVMSVNATAEIPADSSYELFSQVFSLFLSVHADAEWIGVFRDSDKGIIQFDVVRIVETEFEARAIASVSGAQSAYEFATGDGLFF